MRKWMSWLICWANYSNKRDAFIFPLTALFFQLLACVPHVRGASQLEKPPCQLKNTLRH